MSTKLIPTKKKPSTKRAILKSYKPTKHFIFRHKLLITLTILLSLTLLSFTNQKYQDWDNARMIKGLAKDFPALVDQINQETGLNLKPKVNCMTTQEKFSSGVSTCELSVATTATTAQLSETNILIKNLDKFEITSEYQNLDGYNANYMNKNSCDFSTKETIYITCTTAVRDANTQLAIDVFNKISQQTPTTPNPAR